MNNRKTVINTTLDEVDSLPLPALGDQPSKNKKEDDLEIDRLAKLSILDYERERIDSAKAMGIRRIASLDAEVEQRQRQIKARDDANELLTGAEPWPYPVDGNQLALEIRELFKKHCVLPAGDDA